MIVFILICHPSAVNNKQRFRAIRPGISSILQNIFNLSKILVEKYDSVVPQTFEELEALPGVGHKTASVMMIHAFKVPAFPVDTHIHRLAKRWGLSDGSSVEQTEKDLKKIFPENEWEKRHLQIILFGRTYCKALGHKPENCPICSKI